MCTMIPSVVFRHKQKVTLRGAIADILPLHRKRVSAYLKCLVGILVVMRPEVVRLCHSKVPGGLCYCAGAAFASRRCSQPSCLAQSKGKHLEGYG